MFIDSGTTTYSPTYTLPNEPGITMTWSLPSENFYTPKFKEGDIFEWYVDSIKDGKAVLKMRPKTK